MLPSSRSKPQIREADVLVVGGGGAGAFAGIAAARAGASVVVAVKGKIGRSGATPTAGADFMADARSVIEILGRPEGDLHDSADEFMLDIVKEGQYLNNQELVELYVENAPYRIRELIEWGMTVTHIENAHNSRFPRGVMTTGPDIGRALRRGVRENRVPLLEDMFVIDLLTDGQQVIGALGLDQKTGTPYILKAGAVVLATGGWQAVYPWTSATEDLTGDGQAIAYRAGADLIDMEMVQFLPGIVIDPPAWRRSIYLYALPAGTLFNRLDEAFLQRWNPEMADSPLSHWPKETTAIAIKMEVLEGRGSPRGGVYFSLKNLPKARIDALAAEAATSHWKADRLDMEALFSYLKAGNSIEVTGDAAHFSTGGIRIDRNCATTVPGLFAAGECAAGTWGAGRVCSALTEMAVQGHVAGIQAARFAADAGRIEPHLDQVTKLLDTLWQPLERLSGPSPITARQQLQKLAGSGVGVVRTDALLSEVIDSLKQLRPILDDLATISKTRRYSREWFEAVQLRNMISVLDISAHCALMRTESRGCHYRGDLPVVDNDHWLVNIAARQREDALELRTLPIAVTKVPPPRGIIPYRQFSGVEERQC
jgi:succinate dehydrogenase/fumarate reductase flavoprotein subunit